MANRIAFLRNIWATCRLVNKTTACYPSSRLRMGDLRVISCPERGLMRSCFALGQLHPSADRGLSSELSNKANNAISGKPTIDNTISMLTMKLERLGRINANDMIRALKTIEGSKEDITDKDYLKLLQFTTRMVEEEYRPCAIPVQQVWKLTDGRDDLVTQTHVELYLKMCYLAEVHINPWDIFQRLKSLNIEPSRDIFELLMLLFGWQGDLSGATDTLAIMRERNIPITETIFSSLIVAHGVNKDPQGIQSVLDTMRSLQITPTNITYEALMSANAISGSISDMKHVVSQMRQAKMNLSQSELSSVLLTLIKNGHSGDGNQNLDYVVGLMEEVDGKIDLSRLLLHCIHSGFVQEAVHLLPRQPLIKQNNHLYSNATVYIREMVHAGIDPNLLVDMCKQLQRQEINQYSLEISLECALAEHREKLVWSLLWALKMNGNPVRQHYFWPLFHSNAVIGDSAKLLEYVKGMVELDVIPDLETLRDHVIPGLIINHPMLTLDMLRKAGLPLSRVVTPLLVVLIKHKMLDQCFEIVREIKSGISLGDLTSPLGSTWAANPKSVITLLASLIEIDKANRNKEDVEPDWGGQFVIDIASSRAGLSVHQIQPLFEELKKHQIGISETSADILMTRVNKTIQQAVQRNLNNVINPALGQPPKEEEYNLLPHPNKMNVEELECHLVELRSKGLNSRGTLRKLLIMHAANNNTERVQALFKEADADEASMSGGMMSSVMTTFAETGNIDAALTIYNEIHSKYPIFVVDCFKVIDLSTILVKEMRTEDAIILLNDYFIRLLKPVNKRSVKRNCWNLLMSAAENNDYETTKTLFSILQSNNIIDADIVILGPLIKAKLNSGDLSGAVKEAENLQREYKCLPMRVEILVQLILHSKQSEQSSLENNNLIQSMLDVIVSSRGSMQARHDLLFACLDAGQPTDARKVLQNLGRNVDSRFVERQCDRYATTEREEPLLHLLAACRGFNMVKQHKIYEALLNLYFKQNAGEKALSLWTMMQEDEVTPTESFLSTLASLLAANNIKIPFRVT